MSVISETINCSLKKNLETNILKSYCIQGPEYFAGLSTYLRTCIKVGVKIREIWELILSLFSTHACSCVHWIIVVQSACFRYATSSVWAENHTERFAHISAKQEEKWKIWKAQTQFMTYVRTFFKSYNHIFSIFYSYISLALTALRIYLINRV